MAMAGLLKLAAKGTAATGILYLSIQQGVWGNAREGAELGRKMTQAIVHPVTETIEKIPSLTDVNGSDKDYWNKGVTSMLNQAPGRGDKAAGKLKPALPFEGASSAQAGNSPSIPGVAGIIKSAAKKKPSTPGVTSLTKPAASSPSAQSKLEANNSLTDQMLKKSSSTSPFTVITSPEKQLVQTSYGKQSISTDVTTDKANAREMKTTPGNKDTLDQSSENSAGGKADSDILKRSVSFRLVKGPKNTYSLESLVEGKTVSSTGLNDPPPSPRPRERSPARPTSFVIQGYNYVSSLSSPPKPPLIRVPTTVRIKSADTHGSLTQCSNQEVSSYNSREGPLLAPDRPNSPCHPTTEVFAQLPLPGTDDQRTSIIKDAADLTISHLGNADSFLHLPNPLRPDTFLGEDLMPPLGQRKMSSHILQENLMTESASVVPRLDDTFTQLLPEYSDSHPCFVATISPTLRTLPQQLPDGEEGEVAAPVMAQLIGAAQDGSPPRPVILSHMSQLSLSPVLTSNTNLGRKFRELRSTSFSLEEKQASAETRFIQKSPKASFSYRIMSSNPSDTEMGFPIAPLGSPFPKINIIMSPIQPMAKVSPKKASPTGKSTAKFTGKAAKFSTSEMRSPMKAKKSPAKAIKTTGKAAKSFQSKPLQSPLVKTGLQWLKSRPAVKETRSVGSSLGLSTVTLREILNDMRSSKKPSASVSSSSLGESLPALRKSSTAMTAAAAANSSLFVPIKQRPSPDLFQGFSHPPSVIDQPERSRSPRGQLERSLSPRVQLQRSLSPMEQFERSLSPRGQFERSLSPRGRFERSLSPRGHLEISLSPSGQSERALSPRGQLERSLSAKEQLTRNISPIGQSQRSPRGQSQRSPRKTMLGSVLTRDQLLLKFLPGPSCAIMSPPRTPTFIVPSNSKGSRI